MSVWDERAASYVESDAHRQGADLDQLIDWAAGARTALAVSRPTSSTTFPPPSPRWHGFLPSGCSWSTR